MIKYLFLHPPRLSTIPPSREGSPLVEGGDLEGVVWVGLCIIFFSLPAQVVLYLPPFPLRSGGVSVGRGRQREVTWAGLFVPSRN